MRHRRQVWRCSICGAEVPDQPMPVLKHQMSHVKRRPYADDRWQPPRPEDDPLQPGRDSDRRLERLR